MTKISIYSSFATNIPIETRIAAIKETGFDAICLDFEKDLVGTETTWSNQLRLAEKYDLPVENVHLTGFGMNSVWAEGEEGEVIINRLIQELQDMASLGIQVGVAHVTWGHVCPAGNMQLGLNRYKRATEAAEQYGVKLALENSVYPQYVRFLLDNIRSPMLGFCFDSGHENAFSKGENYLADYAQRLFAMHLHDNDGEMDSHGIPMTGTICWEKTISQMRSAPIFKRVITLECSLNSANMMEDLNKAYLSAQKLIAL